MNENIKTIDKVKFKRKIKNHICKLICGMGGKNLHNSIIDKVIGSSYEYIDRCVDPSENIIDIILINQVLLYYAIKTKENPKNYKYAIRFKESIDDINMLLERQWNQITYME